MNMYTLCILSGSNMIIYHFNVCNIVINIKVKMIVMMKFGQTSITDHAVVLLVWLRINRFSHQ